MNKEQNLNEPQNQQLNIAGVSGSVFIQEKIWNKYSKIVSGELSDLQHCAGTNLMHRVEFNHALDAIIPNIDDAGVIAVKISEMVEPPLTAQEQAFFIAGFQECIKWLRLACT